MLAPAAPEDVVRRHVLAAALTVLGEVEEAGARGGLVAPPAGWRNVAGVPEVLSLGFDHAGQSRSATVARAWARAGSTYWLGLDVDAAALGAQTIASDDRFERLDGLRLSADSLLGLTLGDDARLEVDGVRSTVRVQADHAARPTFCDDDQPREPRHPRAVRVLSDGWTTEFQVVEPWAASAHDGGGAGPTTPVPGTVTHVAVAVGDEVEAGAALVVLEAMKMEHTIRADAAGTVTGIHVSVGQSVDAHTVVATIEATP